MSVIAGRELLSTVNGEPPLMPEVPIPSGSENTSGQVPDGDGSGGSQNVLWMPQRIPAGTRGHKWSTARDFWAQRLFGSAQVVSLVVAGLPFHGVGSTLAEAQEDLVMAMEETLDELEADLRAGIRLSAHLERALEFVRHVFHAGGGKQVADPRHGESSAT